jgi:hypothetical protein
MAFELTCTERFPPGTEVTAYEAAGVDTWTPRNDGAPGRPRTQPPGPAVETQTMGAHGAKFNALDIRPGSVLRARYFFAAEIADEWVILGATGR